MVTSGISNNLVSLIFKDTAANKQYVVTAGNKASDDMIALVSVLLIYIFNKKNYFELLWITILLQLRTIVTNNLFKKNNSNDNNNNNNSYCYFNLLDSVFFQLTHLIIQFLFLLYFTSSHFPSQIVFFLLLSSILFTLLDFSNWAPSSITVFPLSFRLWLFKII